MFDAHHGPFSPLDPLHCRTSAELGYRPIRATATASGGVTGFGSPLPSPSVSPTALAAAAGAASAEVAAPVGGPAPPPGLPVPQLWQPMGQVAGVPIIGGAAALQPAAGAVGLPVSDLVKAEPLAAGTAGLAAVDGASLGVPPDTAPVNGRKALPQAPDLPPAKQPTNGAAVWGSLRSHPHELPAGSPMQVRADAAPPAGSKQADGHQHSHQQSAPGAGGRDVAMRAVESAAATQATSEAAAIAAAAEHRVLSGLQ